MRVLVIAIALFFGVERPLEWWVAEHEAETVRRRGEQDELLLESVPDVPIAWLDARSKAWERDVAELRPFVEQLRRRLASKTILSADLKTFLERPDAADLLYRRFLRPHLGKNPISRAVGGVFATRDDGRLHIPAAFRPRAAKLFADWAALDGKSAEIRRELKAKYTETGVDDLAWTARSIAARLAPGDDLTENWRARLVGDHAVTLATLAKEPVRPDLVRLLLDHTRFGHCLVYEQVGAVTINRHTYFEMDALLRELMAAPGPLHDRPILAEMAERRAKCRPLPEAGHADPEEGKIAGIRGELAAEESELTLDLEALPWDDTGIDLFRSQVFYNPRTAAGNYWYRSEFVDHPIARLFGTFGWTAKTTKSVDDFLAKLDQRMPHLRSLAKTHEKLIVLINTMPPWLSASDDAGQFEGERRSNQEAHPPRDWETWRKMIRGMVTRLMTIEGVEWYYEFWNEPDLQYWQGDLPSFLKLYGETVKAIKAVDPEAKVGGCAPNQWDGKLKKAKDADPINLELIRYVAKHELPFDFISWHVFGRPIEAIAEAKERYTEELTSAGIENLPEFLVTEWSVPYRGTAYAPANMAERMVGFFEARVDVQTIACWEEFHRKPDPKHFPPWGMLTQQGHRKPSYYVHRFFDRIARGSEGVAIVRREGGWRAVVSRKADGVYDLIVWRQGVEPRFKAALDALRQGGFTDRHGRYYTSYDRLERAILDGRPVPKGLEPAFAAAKKGLLEHPVKTPRLLLTLHGASGVEVLFAESVRMEHRIKDPVARQNQVTCPLVPFEVLRLKLRVLTAR